MTSPDLLNVPLSKDEARNVDAWRRGIAPLVPQYGLSLEFVGKTPEYVALMLRMDGYTSVRDRDVMKACGRI